MPKNTSLNNPPTGKTNCKQCRKLPRCIDNYGQTSLYCSNACAKKAGGALPKPEDLIKRAKDLSLGQLLEQEAEIEKAKADQTVPDSVVAITKSGIWKIDSKEGQRGVLISRTFRNEAIRLQFSIDELDPFEPDEDSDEENDEAQTRDQTQAQESDDDDDDEDEDPIQCSISITKSRQGALWFDCWVSPAKGIEVLKVSYINDKRLVSEDTADSAKKLSDFAVGPEYEDLPKRIKEEFTNYLNDRGIDDSLAQAITEFFKYKTQKEALEWFKSIGGFVTD